MSGFNVNFNFTESSVLPDCLRGAPNVCARCLRIVPCVKGGLSGVNHLNRPHTYHQWVRTGRNHFEKALVLILVAGVFLNY